jgi:cytochrome c553
MRKYVFGLLSVSLLTGMAAAAPDLGAGKAASAPCQACHGAQGISVAPNFPNLAGQKAPYLMAQLKAFKSGARKNDIMNAMAKQLSDQDIENLAAFWSSLPPGGPAGGPAGGTTAAADPAAEIRASNLTVMPAGFPKEFVAYSTVNRPDLGQVRVMYANRAAMAAAKADKSLPDGSAVVMARYKPKADADGKPIAGPDGVWTPGELLGYGVMEARAGWGDKVPALLQNGNWHYNDFNADLSLKPGGNQAPCLACHKPLSGDNYLFSIQAMKVKAKAG